MRKRGSWVFSVVLVLGSTVAVAQDAPLFTSDFPASEFTERRAAVAAAIGDAALAVVQGAPSPGGSTRFRQSNDFYYLCGVETPHAYLIVDGRQKKSSLYLPHRNEGRERGEGKLLSAEDVEEVKKLTGVDSVFGTDLLAEHLARAARGMGPHTLYTPLQPAEGLSVSRDNATRTVADSASDPWDGGGSREARFVRLLGERFPQLAVKDLSPILDARRLIKSERELVLIRKATKLASLALLEGMRSTKPGIWEHELDGVSKFVFYRNGAQGEAYFSLIASASNAWYPHYNAGKRQMKDGEFLLMDHAPDVGYYDSDVTRMWPVNGKFNGWQRELYGFYLDCYKAILKAIRPGVTAGVIMKEAAKEMDGILARSKFSKPAYEKGAKEFVESYRKSADSPYGALGHWVGMSVHDVGSHDGPLRAGMVFTIEPALRVPEEKIYVRLEDVIVIGEKKAEILTDWLPMDIPTIEKTMTEEGMLQKYPRVGE